MKDFFSTGAGKEAFGQWQSIAIGASIELEKEIVAIAKEVTKSGDISGEQEIVYSWAERNPIKSLQFIRKSTTALFAEVLGETSMSVTSAAFSMAENVAELSSRLNAYARFLPMQARWQVEYMAQNFIKPEDLESGLDDFSTIAQSTERAVDIIEQLPQLVQNERVSLLKEIDRQRISSMKDLINERMAVLDMIQTERIAIIAELRKERTGVMEELRKERVEIIKELDDLTYKALTETSSQLKEVVDHFFLCLIQVMAVVIVLGLAALFIFRRKGAVKSP